MRLAKQQEQLTNTKGKNQALETGFKKEWMSDLTKSSK